MVRSGYNSHKTRYFTRGLITSAVLFFSCAPVVTNLIVVPELDADGAQSYAQKWEKYGAYYDHYITTFTTSFFDYQCFTRLEIDLAMNVLTNDGAQYATLPLPKTNHAMVVDFEPHLFDAAKAEIPVDKKKILAGYQETGKVVFPKVTVGSRITLKFAIYLPYYYSAYWFRFASPIPSRITGLVHVHSGTSVYDYKVLGNKYSLLIDSIKSNSYHKMRSWVIHDYEPQKELDYLDYTSVTEPLVALRLREVKCWVRKYNSKKDIFSACGDEYIPIKRDITEDPLLKPALNSCIAGTKDRLAQAQQILRWVQRSITITNSAAHGGEAILKNKTGSHLQAACLCKVMLNKAGIPAEIVFAYDNDDLCMDTSFVFFNEYLATPLLIVQFGSRPFVAYPYEVGWELGEYPSNYNGVMCIQPEAQKIDSLPPPLWGTRWVRDRMVIDLGSSPVSCRLIREYRLHSAASNRNTYAGLGKEKLREKFENLIKEYSPSYRLVSFSFRDFYENPDGPFSVDIRFESDQVPLRSAGKNIFPLKDFLPTYFRDITPERTEDVVVHETATYIDEVEILKLPGKTMTCDMKLKEMSTALFSASCTSAEIDSSYLFCRTLNLKRVRLTKEQISGASRDCAELNDFENSIIVF